MKEEVEEEEEEWLRRGEVSIVHLRLLQCPHFAQTTSTKLFTLASSSLPFEIHLECNQVVTKNDNKVNKHVCVTVLNPGRID